METNIVTMRTFAKMGMMGTDMNAPEEVDSRDFSDAEEDVFGVIFYDLCKITIEIDGQEFIFYSHNTTNEEQIYLGEEYTQDNIDELEDPENPQGYKEMMIERGVHRMLNHPVYGPLPLPDEEESIRIVSHPAQL